MPDFERPNYYAVIPADVRYDQELSPNEKLLYGEISALTGSDGYCFASNGFFAQVYGFSQSSVTRMIKHLEDRKYLQRVVIRDQAGAVVQRKIYLLVSVPEIQPPIKENGTSPQDCGDPPRRKNEYNNTSITDIEKENKKEKAATGKRTPLTDEQLLKLFVDWIAGIGESWQRSQKNDLYFALAGFYAPRENKKSEPARTQAAFTALSNRLLRHSAGDPAVMIDMLERATTAGWKSVFPLGGDNGQQQKQQSTGSAGSGGGDYIAL